MPNTLKATLKRQWFDQIYTGKKTEEFRTYSKFWKSRLLQKDEDGNFTKVPREYDTVLFRNGYNPDSPTMEVEYKGLKIDEYRDVPKNHPDRYEFAIQLGKVLNTANYVPG